MTGRVMPAPPINGKAACADRLDLVDAAAAKPGGLEAQDLKRLCRHCPVRDDCLTWGMTHAEVGIWGGVSPQVRKKHGAPGRLPVVDDTLRKGTTEKPASTTTPLSRRRGTQRPARTVTRLAELGTTSTEVKRWAYDHGLIRSMAGRVAMATIDAWATAHARQAAS